MLPAKGGCGFCSVPEPSSQLRPRLQISPGCPELKTSHGNKPKALLLCFPAPLGLDQRDRGTRLFGLGSSVVTAPCAALCGASQLPGSVSVHHGPGGWGKMPAVGNIS